MYAPSKEVSGPNPLEAPGRQTIRLKMDQWDVEVGFPGEGRQRPRCGLGRIAPWGRRSPDTASPGRRCGETGCSSRCKSRPPAHLKDLCGGRRSSTTRAASAATPARRPASRRTRCRSASPAPTSSTSTSGTFPQARRAFQVTRCNQCADAPCVARLPDRRDVHAARTASSTSTSRSASAARRAWPPARTTRSSSTPRTTRRRNATSARTASTWASSRPAWSSARPQAILVGDLNDPGSRGRADRQPRAGGGAPAGEGDPAQALLQGRAPGDARSAGGAPARGRHSSCGASRQRRRPRRLRPSRRRPSLGPVEQLGGGAPLLRRAAPRAVGLAGEPLHLDQGRSPPARYLVPLLLVLTGAVGGRRAALGAGPRRCSARVFLAADRRPAHLRTSSTRALLPDPHPAAVAELAGARAPSSSPATARVLALHARSPRSPASRSGSRPLAVAGAAAGGC